MSSDLWGPWLADQEKGKLMQVDLPPVPPAGYQWQLMRDGNWELIPIDQEIE